MFHSSSQVLLTVLGGHLSSSLGNLWQSLSPPPLMLSLGCAPGGGACQGVERQFPSRRSPLGGSCGAQPFPAQAGSGFGWGWDVPRVRAPGSVWSGLGQCPFGCTPPSATAQNKHCANCWSLKQAIRENCWASTKIKTNQSGQWLQESVFAWSVF